MDDNTSEAVCNILNLCPLRYQYMNLLASPAIFATRGPLTRLLAQEIPGVDTAVLKKAMRAIRLKVSQHALTNSPSIEQGVVNRHHQLPSGRGLRKISCRTVLSHQAGHLSEFLQSTSA